MKKKKSVEEIITENKERIEYDFAKNWIRTSFDCEIMLLDNPASSQKNGQNLKPNADETLKISHLGDISTF